MIGSSSCADGNEDVLEGVVVVDDANSSGNNHNTCV